LELRVDEGKPFLRRVEEFWALKGPLVQPLVYSRPKWEGMASHHSLFLEAPAEGVVLFDRGGWENLKRRFEKGLAEGRVRRWGILGQEKGPSAKKGGEET